MRIFVKFSMLIVIILIFGSCSTDVSQKLDLSKATILISSEINSPVKESAASILTEEIDKRTQLQLQVSEKWDNKTVIAVALSGNKELFG